MRAIIPFEAAPSQLLILLTINWTLVWWLRSSLNNSGVIPANPGSESGVARAGIQEFQRLLDTGFRRYDGEELNDLFNELWVQDTSLREGDLWQTMNLVGQFIGSITMWSQRTTWLPGPTGQ